MFSGVWCSPLLWVVESIVVFPHVLVEWGVLGPVLGLPLGDVEGEAGSTGVCVMSVFLVGFRFLLGPGLFCVRLARVSGSPPAACAGELSTSVAPPLDYYWVFPSGWGGVWRTCSPCSLNPGVLCPWDQRVS